MQRITELSDEAILAQAQDEVAESSRQRRNRDLVLIKDWYGADESPPTTPYEALMRAGPNEPEVSTMEQRHPLEVVIAEVLGKLSDDDRTVAVMAFVEGLPARRIAELMGVPKSTVHDRLKRLRLRLADDLSKHDEIKRYR